MSDKREPQVRKTPACAVLGRSGYGLKTRSSNCLSLKFLTSAGPSRSPLGLSFLRCKVRMLMVYSCPPC